MFVIIPEIWGFFSYHFIKRRNFRKKKKDEVRKAWYHDLYNQLIQLLWFFFYFKNFFFNPTVESLSFRYFRVSEFYGENI